MSSIEHKQHCTKVVVHHTGVCPVLSGPPGSRLPHLLCELVKDLPVHYEPLTTGTVLAAIQEGGLEGNGDNLGGRNGQPPEQRGGQDVQACCEAGGSVAGMAVCPSVLTAIGTGKKNPGSVVLHVHERRTPASHSS